MVEGVVYLCKMLFRRRFAISSDVTTECFEEVQPSVAGEWILSRLARLSFAGDIYGYANQQLGESGNTERILFQSFLRYDKLWFFHVHPRFFGKHTELVISALHVWNHRESRTQDKICLCCIYGCAIPTFRPRPYNPLIPPGPPHSSLHQRHWKLLQISSSKQQLEHADLDEVGFPRGTEDASVPSKTINCLPTAVPPRV